MTLRTESPGIELQDRDVDLLRGLYESRLLTLSHAAALYFDGKSEAAKKRLQKLKSAGLVSARARRPGEPSVLYLTRKGFELLKNRGALDGYPAFTAIGFEKRSQVKDLTLRHELEVMDVKAAMVTAIRTTAGFDIAEFSTWPALYEFKAAQSDGAIVTVKPDGFIRIHEDTPAGELYEHTFFLEVDRSTETQDVLIQKAHCYRDYYRRGGLAEKHGRPRSEYESFPFRVLMVFRNAERRNNVAERLLLLHPPILSQVWLTTFAEATTDPLGPIWVRPMDYRAVTGGTAFEVTADGKTAGYRRQSEREAFVEPRVTKQMLLCG